MSQYATAQPIRNLQAFKQHVKINDLLLVYTEVGVQLVGTFIIAQDCDVPECSLYGICPGELVIEQHETRTRDSICLFYHEEEEYDYDAEEYNEQADVVIPLEDKEIFCDIHKLFPQCTINKIGEV